jgi:hypothetical protein
VDKGGRRALWWAIAAVVLVLPLAPVGLAFAVVSIITGVRAQRRASARGTAAPGSTAAIIIGVLGSIVGACALVVLVLFFPELRDYQTCLAGANTSVAKSACEQDFRDAVQHKIGARP